MLKRNIFSTTIFILSISSILFFVGCGQAVYHPIQFEISKYNLLGNPSSWEKLSPRLDAGEVLVLETVDGKLAVLGKESQSQKRKLEDINYAGFVFYHDALSRTDAFNAHQVKGVLERKRIVDDLVKVRKYLTKLPRLTSGYVIVVDGLSEITDSQTQSLATAPANCLVLNSVTYINGDQAETLAGFEGRSLCLDGLLWISDLQAEQLVTFSGYYLSLNSVQTMTKAQVKAMCRFNGKQLRLEALGVQSRQLVKVFRQEAMAELITATGE